MGQSFPDSPTTWSSSQFSLSPLWLSLSLKPELTPKLTPPSSMAPMDMVSPILEPMEPMEPTVPTAHMPMAATTTARGLLRPSPRLRLMPMLTTDTTAMPAPTPMVPMVPVMDTDMVPTPMPVPTTTRGPLMPSPRLRPTPPSSIAPMDMASPMLEPTEPMVDTEPMVPTPIPMVATPTARDLLRPSPRLRLTPLSSTPPPALPLL